MLDIIVIGGGHAGIEAALACARMGKETLLFTLHIDMIGSMPCNPSVGGPAKGIVVREIDALGGEMGRAADATALQFKMLNTTKGPGVQCLRVQSDKIAYRAYMQNAVLHQAHLRVEEACVEELIVRNNTVCGVRLADGREVESRAVILTSGTFMSSTILVGHSAHSSGPEGEPTTNALSQSLRDHGIATFRLKTGTPARVKSASIDFSQLEEQPGTKEFVCFSEDTKEILPYAKQQLCYLTYTSPKTHEIIREHLQDSAMYSGLVKGVGPRYCPSIEDKLVRFADKPRHQIFLEPESLSLDTTYVQGFSTSMPHEVQTQMLHSLPGLEHCEIDKFGYAIEYDAIDPLQCHPTLENKIISHLYTAGQVNGTSGYEEAAAQGLMAAINAVAKLEGKEPLILGREEAYIGVMIDDLVTKGTKEPYRLLTSRAEYRLLLRHDNADARLTPYGYAAGLISEERYQRYQRKQQAMKAGMAQLKEMRFTPKSKINEELCRLGYEPLKEGISAYELLRRPKVTLQTIAPYVENSFPMAFARQIEIEIKYEGYIEKAKRDAHRMRAMDRMRIPAGLDYASFANLSLEARQKLALVQPMTLGQASRISGVNPSDIALLAMALQQRRQKEAQTADEQSCGQS